jgi:hypothetical protein
MKKGEDYPLKTRIMEWVVWVFLWNLAKNVFDVGIDLFLILVLFDLGSWLFTGG